MTSLFRSEIAYVQAAQRRVRDWVAALRGGRYQQSREGMLRTERGHCVLGVGCDRYDPRGWSHVDGEWRYRGALGSMPAPVADDFLLATTDGRYGPNPETDTIAHANDAGMGFPEIADLIERELESVLRRVAARNARRRGRSSEPRACARPAAADPAGGGGDR